MEYVAIRLSNVHNAPSLSAGAARTLVGYALRRRGRESWSVICAEVFCGRGRETLVLARPSAGVEARFADYLYPMMRKYFTK